MSFQQLVPFNQADQFFGQNNYGNQIRWLEKF
jgi:hypothetical protein